MHFSYYLCTLHVLPISYCVRNTKLWNSHYVIFSSLSYSIVLYRTKYSSQRHCTEHAISASVRTRVAQHTKQKGISQSSCMWLSRFWLEWTRRLQPPVRWHRVVWLTGTNTLEETAASIFRVEKAIQILFCSVSTIPTPSLLHLSHFLCIAIPYHVLPSTDI